MLQAPASKLVGRAIEFRRLTRVLDQAVAEEPMVALVSGDAGMGKTRLVAALADAIAARPVLGMLLPDRDNAELAGGEVTGMARQQLFGAVLGMLAELADKTPVLLVLEDMHWADRSTRDLLTFLSRVLHRERVAVIAT